jgi:hypothetical protein
MQIQFVRREYYTPPNDGMNANDGFERKWKKAVVKYVKT